MSTDKRSIDWYNQNSKHYTKHVRNPDDSIYHSLYEKPAMYDLLPELGGKSVISLGCGSGEDCDYLVQQGASQVTGIDIAEGMIEIARATYPGCQFQVMDMEDLAFNDASFDFAYSSLAIHYIKDWSKVFSEVYRILKPNSFFLFSCNHPVASAMQTTKDNSEDKNRVLSVELNRHTHRAVVVGNYMHRRILEEDPNFDVTTWHKPIGEISSEASSVGFVIANVVEPKPLPRMKELSEKDYTILQKIPGFLILKLFKA